MKARTGQIMIPCLFGNKCIYRGFLHKEIAHFD